MNKDCTRSVLTEEISNLSLSTNFKKMAQENGFETLEEVLSFSVESLMNRPHFSMHVYHELYKFLEKEGYLAALKIE